ncbi:MAG: hypothetical protein AB7F88_17335 [Pyrinomonadaceae bacterium]
MNELNPNNPDAGPESSEPNEAVTERLVPPEPVEPVDDRPRIAAEEAKPLALFWIDYGLMMLRTALRSFEPESPADVRINLALDTLRRHFHTDRRDEKLTEKGAIELVEQNFQTMRRSLAASASIFRSADDETASQNTRGYFGSGLTVAAYAYTHKSISFTSHFPPLGPRCKSAVIVHQLAHFIDARMRDHSCGGLIYDLADFEASLFNVHCYPNFAVNATPPYLDERYGMTRPEI